MLKYFSILFALVLMFNTSAIAQGKGKGKGKGKGNTEHGHGNGGNHGQAGEHGQGKSAEQRAQTRSQQLQKKLGLSTDQTTQTYNVLLSTIQQIDAIRKNGNSGGDNKAKIQAIRDQKEQQLKGIFTPEQYTKYLALKDEHKKEHGGKDEDDDDDAAPAPQPAPQPMPKPRTGSVKGQK